MNNNVNPSSFNYKTGVNPDAKQSKKEVAPKEKKEKSPEVVNNKYVNADEALNYLVSMGNMNINFKGGKTSDINPEKFLSAERIQEIESSMSLFEELYSVALDSIESEFGSMLSNKAKEELAWKTLA